MGASSVLPSIQDIPRLSSFEKRVLMQTVADEMTSIFISISRGLREGILQPHHTAPLHKVIHTIQQTSLSTQRRQERRLARYQLRARRLREERRWIREEFAEVVRQWERVHEQWKTRVKGLREANGALN